MDDTTRHLLTRYGEARAARATAAATCRATDADFYALERELRDLFHFGYHPEDVPALAVCPHTPWALVVFDGVPRLVLYTEPTTNVVVFETRFKHGLVGLRTADAVYVVAWTHHRTGPELAA